MGVCIEFVLSVSLKLGFELERLIRSTIGTTGFQNLALLTYYVAFARVP